MMEISSIQTIKVALVAATGLSRDALHIYVGLIVFFSVAVIFKKPLRSIVPWLAVLIVATTGELFDRHDDLINFGYWRLDASIHDIVNTQFWPALLSLLARYTKLFGSVKAPDK